MVYRKLVRDNIPSLMEGQGKHPVIGVLDREEYFRALEAKLDEETEEFHRDKNAGELADILEVAFSLGEVLGFSREELMDLCQEKAAARGGFRDRIFLVSDEGEL